MIPNSNIVLCNVSEYTSRDNTYLFNSLEEQKNFYLDNKINVLENNSYTYIRKDSTINLDININDIYNVNYLFYTNGFKTYYCWVNDKEYINDYTTKIKIEIDVIQTYMFDYILSASYVDRMHVNRWNEDGTPTISENMQEEGLETGTPIQTELKNIYTMKDNFLVMSTNPLGCMQNRQYTGGIQYDLNNDNSNTNSNNNNVNTSNNNTGFNTCISKEFLRSIKASEGFSSTLYHDSNGTPTIGYGITDSDGEFYTKLVNNQPVSEELASKVLFESINTNYAVPIYNVCKDTYKLTKQCQFDSLVDIAFNCGCYAITGTSQSLPKALINHLNDIDYVRPIFIHYYDKVSEDGELVVSDGLVNRRIVDFNMFYYGDYNSEPISIVGGGVVTENNGNGWLP